MRNLDSVLKKQSYPFANKGPQSQSYGFSSSHVQMWDLDHKKLSTKEFMFLNVVLEKTLESPLDCKEVKPVNPKGNQSWIFIGRTDAEAKFQYFDHLMQRNDLFESPWCWERLKARGEEDNRGWDGWMASPTQWIGFGWTPGVGDGQGGLVCCSSWGRKESDSTEWLNWTELMVSTQA